MRLSAAAAPRPPTTTTLSAPCALAPGRQRSLGVLYAHIRLTHDDRNEPYRRVGSGRASRVDRSNSRLGRHVFGTRGAWEVVEEREHDVGYGLGLRDR